MVDRKDSAFSGRIRDSKVLHVVRSQEQTHDSGTENGFFPGTLTPEDLRKYL